MKKRHTFALLSYVKKSKNDNPGSTPVYLRITIDGKRTEVSTKTYVNRFKWLSGKGRLKTSTYSPDLRIQTVSPAKNSGFVISADINGSTDIDSSFCSMG